MFRKKEIFGYVKTKDGTEFEIREKKESFDRQVSKLKSKLYDSSDNSLNDSLDDTLDDSPDNLCLYNCGQIYDAEEVLSFPFIFDEESSERNCKNFLKFLRFPANVSAVLVQSTFNKYMIEQIINKENNLISDSVIRELIISQDIFPFYDFISNLPIEMRMVLFTENVYRTKTNMQEYKKLIEDSIKDIIKANISNCFIFGYKELNLIDSENELVVQLLKINENYFDSTFDFKGIINDLKSELENEQYDVLDEMDNIKYIIESVNNNSKPYNKEKILSKYELILSEIKRKYEDYNSKISNLNKIFNN